LSLEIRDNGLSAADGEEVVDVYSDEEYAGAGATVVDAVLTFETNKAPRQHGVVESMVPDKPTLLHAVESLLKFPYVIFKTRLNESLRLLHVADLVRVEKTVEECRLDVQLLDFPVESSTKVSEDVERLKACSRRRGLHIILPPNSRVATAYIPCFEMCWVARLIPLKFEYRSSFHDFAASGNRGARDEFIDSKITKGLEFVTHSSSPVSRMG
jgi:hypothetical protein